MKRLLGRAAIFCAPFILLAMFVAVVDPFDSLGFSSVISDGVKSEAAEALHNPLWKVQKFRGSPSSRLILGDSSMASLNIGEIRSLTGQEYFNFAYGGGTLAEAVDTYWFAASRVHLDAVYIGIGFVNFNAYQNLNRVPEAIAIGGSPLRYLTNRIVVGAAFNSAYTALTGNVVNLEAPPMSREAFWRYQIDESLPQLLHEYRYPSDMAKQLERVATDCHTHGTRLVIVIPPSNTELQRQIVALGRGADAARFKAFVKTLGTVYDLDYPNAFTGDRANFSDPFHTLGDQMIIQEVWGNRQLYSHRTSLP
jgi:hypothetical protein